MAFLKAFSVAGLFIPSSSQLKVCSWPSSAMTLTIVSFFISLPPSPVCGQACRLSLYLYKVYHTHRPRQAFFFFFFILRRRKSFFGGKKIRVVWTEEYIYNFTSYML